VTRAEAFTARLDALATRAGAAISSAEALQLFYYYELLIQWNKAVNLTALPLTEYPDESLSRLIVEPIVAAQVVPATEIAWVDIGSGGGSPAIPVKVVRPLARLILAEPRQRKVAFLREVVRALGLTETQVTGKRVEDGVAPPGSIDLATVRGVRMHATLVQATRACLKDCGRLLSFGVALPDFYLRPDSGVDTPQFEQLPNSPLDLRGIAPEADGGGVNPRTFRPLFVYDCR
jgi:16S rRNA (guanine(527)-N(7))-methyltransferase RsmG